MGVFDDKKFDQLDWVSQAIEPIASKLNDVLANIPDETKLDFKTFNKIIEDSYNLSINQSRALDYLLGTDRMQLTWNQRNILQDCLKFKVDGDVIVNYEDNTLTGGTIKIVKVVQTLDEKVLEKNLGIDGIDLVGSIRYGDDKTGVGRANEILELLGKSDEGIRTKSEHRKRGLLIKRLRELFKDNEWKIKDTELADKVGKWIHAYIEDGNLAAYSNFCRLKVMTHKEQAIYSMEEIT